jgi:hypothetical protein
VIYCVVPEPLAAELYDQLVEHYRDDPEVTVIVDRRRGPNRRDRTAPRAGRGPDRRRRRPSGSFPTIEPGER